MKPKHQRMMLIGLAVLAVAGATALILTAFQDAVVFFHTPSELAQKHYPESQRLRIGGLVEKGSVAQTPGGGVKFIVTDTVKAVPVTFTGLLPDLFREGQGVVAEGHLKNGVFVATEVLAKHDEKYMPKEVADALKKMGEWKGPTKDKP